MLNRIVIRMSIMAQKLTGFLSYFSCFLNNVKLGRGSTFYGKTYFRNQVGSDITLGSNCTFRSSKTSNWIGVNRPCLISTQGKDSAKIIIGNNCGFTGSIVAAFKEIQLGNNVRCGANTLITDSDWHADDPRVGPAKSIKIGDNVWLGVNAVVLKGVSIGENTIIGANSVVTSSLPANVIAVGNPCRVVKLIKPNG
jgi:acetyltransferase-like isoleucine patch superfamily enzyme